MQVVITSGGYGLKRDENRIELVLRGETVDVSEEEAALLIDQGAAVAVTADSAVGDEPDRDGEVETCACPETESDREEEDDDAAYSMDNTVAELRAIMESEGLKIRSGMTKREMIDVLDEHFGTDDDAEDDDQPPALSAEAPVI